MEINEKFARYILSLQSIAKLERGLDENYDISYRNKLEDSFPILKEERETEDFKDWIIKEKIYTLPKFKELEKTIGISASKLMMLSVNSHSSHTQARQIIKLHNLKEKYYKQFINDIKIKNEYKLLKTIKKLSK